MNNTLALNIGGTTIKWAHFEDEPLGHVAARLHPTPATRDGFRAFLQGIAERHVPAAELVSIGFPGPVGAHGELTSACTWMPGEDLSDFDLDACVRSVWPRARTAVINDVTAYGEFLLREGQRDFCVINIGSGIGSKLYAGGQLVLGPGRRGGEIGHWVDSNVPMELLCDCGGLQHVGAMASGRGVARYVRLRAPRLEQLYAKSSLGAAGLLPAELTEAHIVAHAHDPFVRGLLAEAIAPLARAATLIHLASGCESFVLVGGFAEALGPLLPALLAERSAKLCWQNGFDWQRAYRVLKDEVSASLIGLHWHGARHAER